MKLTKAQVRSRLLSEASAQDITAMLLLLVSKERLTDLILTCPKKKVEALLLQRFDWHVEISKDT